MSDLDKIFNSSISTIANEQDKLRDEGQKKIEDSGIKEIFDYIAQHAWLSLPHMRRTKEEELLIEKLDESQKKNDKLIMEKLIEIANRSFYYEHGFYLDKDIVYRLYLSKGICEDRCFYFLGIKVHFGASIAVPSWGDAHRNSIFTAASGKEKEIQIFRSDDHKNFINIDPSEPKEKIMEKIIQLIMS